MIQQDEYDYAFTLGEKAHEVGEGVNMDPYDQNDEETLYEAWVDGWSHYINTSNNKEQNER